jgi:hypothetical protein
VAADDWSYAVYWRGLGGAAGGVFLEVRQVAWEGLGAQWRPLALALLVREGLRARRIDLALDDWGVRCRPGELFSARAEARTRTHRDGWELTVRGSGETKLTVGSRASERYLRVYDKPVGKVWRVRHEVELKGDAATAAGGWIGGGLGLRELWAREVSRLVAWPSVPGWAALTAAPPGLPPAPATRQLALA